MIRISALYSPQPANLPSAKTRHFEWRNLTSQRNHYTQYCNPLIQFLMLFWPLVIKLFSLILHNYNFATIMNHNINIWYIGYLVFNPQRGRDPQVENHTALCAPRLRNKEMTLRSPAAQPQPEATPLACLKEAGISQDFRGCPERGSSNRFLYKSSGLLCSHILSC